MEQFLNTFDNDCPTLPDRVRGMSWQLEICPSTNRLHVQGVVQYKDKVTLNTAQQIISVGSSHMEACRGSIDKNLGYVSKGDSAVEGTHRKLGSFVGQGQRTDLEEYSAAIVAGANLPQLVDKGFAKMIVKYPSGTKALIETIDNKHVRNMAERPIVRVFWGPTSVGKSVRAKTEALDRARGNLEGVYWKTPSSKWWDGYVGQKYVIIDEFAGQVPITTLNEWLDHGAARVEFKGGSCQLRATHFWITSNIRPEDWYNVGVSRAQVDALLARLTIIEMAQAAFIKNENNSNSNGGGNGSSVAEAIDLEADSDDYYSPPAAQPREDDWQEHEKLRSWIRRVQRNNRIAELLQASEELDDTPSGSIELLN